MGTTGSVQLAMTGTANVASAIRPDGGDEPIRGDRCLPVAESLVHASPFQLPQYFGRPRKRLQQRGRTSIEKRGGFGVSALRLQKTRPSEHVGGAMWAEA